MRHIAIIGAGPTGLEAALHALGRGFGVTVYEAGRIGAHVWRFGHVTLFTPFAMNSTPLGRERVVSSGGRLPAEDALLTGRELVERYLEPLAALPELEGSIRTCARVTHVGREGLTKGAGLVGEAGRSGRSFLLRIENGSGHARLERADIVLDASGVYGNPNWTGPGGLPALGEEGLGPRIERHVPSLTGPDRARYAGARILLVGDGHSAATALLEWDALARAGGKAESPRVDWVLGARGERPFVEVPHDPLPSRLDLAVRANAVALEAPWLTPHRGWMIREYEEGADGGIRARLVTPEGMERVLEVDRVLALVGYRPDLEMTRELQVHLCYASEGPMKLAAAVLSASREAPGRVADCLAQVAHGPESLRNPEPDFFILGAKSYGRNPAFLLTLGHRQIEDVFSLIGVEQPLQIAAPSTSR